ncbi:hypothetical protein ACIRG5_01070 [Lentzea sp. NPDC102401]|uniref:hypothetical protein n=1 Tax=Lentzea sp. NPDC102401 TaxID=3364128 RepID=UPI00381735FA
MERVRREYLSVLDQGMLPCPAIGRSPSLDTPFGTMPLIIGVGRWMAECHVGHSDQATAADCARHRRARSPGKTWLRWLEAGTEHGWLVSLLDADDPWLEQAYQGERYQSDSGTCR